MPAHDDTKSFMDKHPIIAWCWLIALLAWAIHIFLMMMELS